MILTGLVCSGAALATGSDGYYLGLQLGESMSDYTTTSSGIIDFFGVPSVPGASIQNDAFAGRVYLGYQFNKFIAAELAYDYFGQVQFEKIYGISAASGDVTQQGTDLTAKVMLPVTKQFDVFALGGVAYVWAKSHDISTTASQLGLDSGSAEGAFAPVYGLGADYNFSDAWGVDLAWRRYLPRGDLSQISMATAGISYHFG